MATLLSRLLPSSTRDFNPTSQALLHILSHPLSRGLGVLGRLFSGAIPCCNVATPSTCICSCCRLSWCQFYNMGVTRCQVSSMHSRRVAGASDARAALQHLYDYYRRIICHLSLSTPCKLLLTDLVLLPLQQKWQQKLQFWNSLAALPVGSFCHTVC